MGIIKQLSNKVIQRIAAGQVVDRPSAMVKELIENALDAGARTIDISLQAGGIEKIVVLDDGHGMELADLEQSFLPHTTSKIATVDDLQAIHSFGFRGEALASMAAVARVTIASRAAGSAHGFQLTVQDGSVTTPARPLGMPVGTQLVVEDLFATVPARKKFLKKAQSEYRAIIAIIVNLSLAHPEVSFSVTHNGQRTLTVSPNQDVLLRFRECIGLPEKAVIVAQEIAEPHLRATLHLAPPEHAERAYRNQFIFVNKRPVQFPQLVQTIKAAYATLLEPKAVPVFLLDIQLDPGLVDVNVDPTKSTVRFMHTDAVLQAVRQAAEEVVRAASAGIHQTPFGVLKKYGINEELAAQFRQTVEPWMPAVHAELDLSSIQQIAKTYLVVPTSEGMLLIDQHAAHESILYAQMKAQTELERENSESQTCHPPETIQLSLFHWQVLQELLPDLEAMGFSVQFVPETHSVVVKQIPILLEGYPLHDYFIELAEAAETGVPQLDQTTHRTLSYLACRTAIKAGEVLTQEQKRELVEKIRETGALTCPHGRPTQVLLRVEQLETLFHRR